MWANSKIIQNPFDSWKCQFLYNKMSKVENSYKPRLKTILKLQTASFQRVIGHKWTNTHVRKFWFPFTWTDLYVYKIFVYANWNLHLASARCKFQEFAYTKILHTCANPCTWTDLHTWVYLHICKYLHTYANLFMWKHIKTFTDHVRHSLKAFCSCHYINVRFIFYCVSVSLCLSLSLSLSLSLLQRYKLKFTNDLKIATVDNIIQLQ